MDKRNIVSNTLNSDQKRFSHAVQPNSQNNSVGLIKESILEERGRKKNELTDIKLEMAAKAA